MFLFIIKIGRNDEELLYIMFYIRTAVPR